MTTLPFAQIDVFTDQPFRGNPVAVVFDATPLTSAQMQQIAHWTRLSETVFVRPSDDADFHLRIFTPTAELPFAGHPTVGAAHAVVERGVVTPRDGHFTMMCGRGLVPLQRRAGVVSATIPRPWQRDVVLDLRSLEEHARIRLHAPMTFDAGPLWVVDQVRDLVALRVLRPDMRALAQWSRHHKVTGLTLFALDQGQVWVRSFAPAHDVDEDPVCGSGNACVAAYRLERQQLAAGDGYVARQGEALGRDGYVHIMVLDAGQVSLGGRCVTTISGEIHI